jgi:chromosomal replication initiation ATPase DnaA
MLVDDCVHQRTLDWTETRLGPAPLRSVDLARIAQASGHRVAIEHTIACVFDVGDKELKRASRGRANVALARQTAMYLAHVACELNLTEVGVLFDRDRTTVAHACGVIEDRRDDRVFDRVIDLLERAVRALLAPRI